MVNVSTPLDKNKRTNWLDLNLGDITKLVESKSNISRYWYLVYQLDDTFMLCISTGQQIMPSKKCI